MLDVVDDIAREKYGGHFCIFSFTTSYKGCFGTIHDIVFRETLNILPEHNSMKDLLTAMATHPENFDAYKISDLISG